VDPVTRSRRTGAWIGCGILGFLVLTDLVHLVYRSSAESIPEENKALVSFRHQQGYGAEGGAASSRLSQALMRKKEEREEKPDYHAPCMYSPISALYSFCVQQLIIRPFFDVLRETQDGHFRSYGLGAVGSGGTRKPVVRDRCRRSSYQGMFLRSSVLTVALN
jgi:hypothetical protein